MSFLERAKQAAEQAKQAAEQARQAAVEATERTTATLRDPATAEKAREKLHVARRGLVTALERIDPGVLADVIIKATLLQERANASLRAKGSPYRISEIGIGASIPPSVTFSIGRLDDPDAEPPEWRGTTTAAAPSGDTITTLDGSKLDDADLEALAEPPAP